ncbi:MAG: Lar family restriction alleviation protein [Oscillospiraceae bacterium]|nr:Lar family restriction alleviation protein [Oscillospiraceae bacterium]
MEEYYIELKPCPFCGNEPEWIGVPGDDYIMRCSVCHASTTTARMDPDEAAEDWNNRLIEDNNFTITRDIKIDEYLINGIKKVVLDEYSIFDSFPETENGFLCSDAVIVTDKIMLSIEVDDGALWYDEIARYNPEAYVKSIAEKDVEIVFEESSWQGDSLKSITFLCGKRKITLAADDEEECIEVREEELL